MAEHLGPLRCTSPCALKRPAPKGSIFGWVASSRCTLCLPGAPGQFRRNKKICLKRKCLEEFRETSHRGLSCMHVFLLLVRSVCWDPIPFFITVSTAGAPKPFVRPAPTDPLSVPFPAQRLVVVQHLEEVVLWRDELLLAHDRGPQLIVSGGGRSCLAEGNLLSAVTASVHFGPSRTGDNPFDVDAALNQASPLEDPDPF